MDNQRIKYNQELIKNKIRLEKQLKMVNKEIDENKKLCDHIRVCLGWDGPFQYRDTSFHTCLFCQKDDPDSQYRMIDATNYRKLKYSHGEYEMAREARLLEIQELAMGIMKENPSITEKQLVEELTEIIKADAENTKTIKKKIRPNFG